MKKVTIKEIKNEFYENNLLYSKAQFECYADGIFTYHVNCDNGFHELCIINENATFFKSEKVCNLLSLKNTFFISHTYFTKANNTFERFSDIFIFSLANTKKYKNEQSIKKQN